MELRALSWALAKFRLMPFCYQVEGWGRQLAGVCTGACSWRNWGRRQEFGSCQPADRFKAREMEEMGPWDSPGRGGAGGIGERGGGGWEVRPGRCPQQLRVQDINLVLCDLGHIVEVLLWVGRSRLRVRAKAPGLPGT